MRGITSKVWTKRMPDINPFTGCLITLVDIFLLGVNHLLYLSKGELIIQALIFNLDRMLYWL
jgi:hypothetical protein